jgi:glycosyltransferase involved in cell wall biosynthesis
MAKRLRHTAYAHTPWDLIAWYSPTIFFGPLIWILKRASRCRTYLILRDIFPEWALDLGLIRKGPAYAFFKAIAATQYAVADVIGVQTPSNLAYMLPWTARGKKVEVLHNWQTPSPDVGTSIQIGTTALAGRKILAYIGNMGVAQGMDIQLDLARALANRDDLGFLFVGRGSEVPRLKDRVASDGSTNTLFFDEVDSTEMPGLLSQCSIGLLALDPRHRTHNIPGKLLTYLRAGLPVLARVNPGTDLAHLIAEEKIGFAYDGNDVTVLCRFVEELIGDPVTYADMSARGRRLADRMFSSERAVRQIVSSHHAGR